MRMSSVSIPEMETFPTQAPTDGSNLGKATFSATFLATFSSHMRIVSIEHEPRFGMLVYMSHIMPDGSRKGVLRLLACGFLQLIQTVKRCDWSHPGTTRALEKSLDISYRAWDLPQYISVSGKKWQGIDASKTPFTFVS
jgi:hypothetical protein